MRRLLRYKGEYKYGIIRSRKRSIDGTILTERENFNTIFKVRMYDIEFIDGGGEEFATNIITESIYSSLGDETKSYTMLSEKLDYRKLDDAVDKPDCMVILMVG